jgi:hypothetical protein
MATTMICAPLVADADIAPIKRKPGSWDMKIVIEALEGDGLDQTSKGKLQGLFDQASIPRCLTEEAADSEDFIGNVLRKGQPGTCNVGKKELTGDVLNIEMACTAPDKQGRMVPMTMSGYLSPISNIMTIKSDQAPTPLGIVKMQMRTESKWAGECTPGQVEI